MTRRKLRNVVAVLAGALAAGAPVLLIRQGADAYIERQASEEVRLAAQHAIAKAEWRIGQTIDALSEIGAVPLQTCADLNAETLRRAVLTTSPL